MSRGAPIEALLFDLGGVVLGVDFARVAAAWAAHAGCEIERVAARFVRDEHYERHERGEIADAEYFEAVRRALALELTQEQLAHGWSSIFTGEVPGVQGILGQLAPRLPLYLFSNTNRAHHAQFAVEYAGLLAPFRECFLSHELGMRKPERRAFEAVAARMGVAPARILFFDDSPANVEGARAAGLRAERVRSAPEIAAALAAHGIRLDTGHAARRGR